LLVLREGITWATVGLALGVAGAMGAGRLIAGLLYGITALDLSTYAVVALSLLLVVIAACLVPASRATKVSPLTSMQAE
jgi:putative ABC transport system permease protein